MKIQDFPKNTAIVAISLYQKTVSPDHSWLRGRFPYGYCRHYPSCSEYTKQSISKFGFIKGSAFGFMRILKCNPWSKPSVDTVR